VLCVSTLTIPGKDMQTGCSDETGIKTGIEIETETDTVMVLNTYIYLRSYSLNT